MCQYQFTDKIAQSCLHNTTCSIPQNSEVGVAFTVDSEADIHNWTIKIKSSPIQRRIIHLYFISYCFFTTPKKINHASTSPFTWFHSSLRNYFGLLTDDLSWKTCSIEGCICISFFDSWVCMCSFSFENVNK